MSWGDLDDYELDHAHNERPPSLGQLLIGTLFVISAATAAVLLLLAAIHLALQQL